MATKILLVDDSRTIRTVVAKTLAAFECEIIEAKNGEEALEVARRELPELIVMDVTMPVMDGEEALKRIKADPELMRIEVIMLSANAGLDEKLRLLLAGASGYLTKKFNPAELIACAKERLTLKVK